MPNRAPHRKEPVGYSIFVTQDIARIFLLFSKKRFDASSFRSGLTESSISFDVAHTYRIYSCISRTPI